MKFLFGHCLAISMGCIKFLSVKFLSQQWDQQLGSVSALDSMIESLMPLWQSHKSAGVSCRLSPLCTPADREYQILVTSLTAHLIARIRNRDSASTASSPRCNSNSEIFWFVGFQMGGHSGTHWHNLKKASTNRPANCNTVRIFHFALGSCDFLLVRNTSTPSQENSSTTSSHIAHLFGALISPVQLIRALHTKKNLQTKQNLSKRRGWGWDM